MPICEKAVSKAIRDPQEKPRHSSQQERHEIPFAKGPGDPAKKIEENQGNVKNEKECIGYLIKGLIFHWHEGTAGRRLKEINEAAALRAWPMWKNSGFPSDPAFSPLKDNKCKITR
jgi:hypothetical protein